jgi:hypothetical protein
MRALMLATVFIVALIVVDVSLSGGFYTSKFAEMAQQIGRSFLR